MFVLVRAVTYATLFIGFVLVYLPGRFLSWSGITRPEFVGAPQVGGILIGAIGAVLALWCLLTFAFIGKGTPAPFDPPRRLVIRGPYRFVRNPMYIGAATALGRHGTLLSIVVPFGFYRAVSSGDAPLRHLVRGTNFTAHFRQRI